MGISSFISYFLLLTALHAVGISCRHMHYAYSDMEEYLGQVSTFITQPMTFMFEGYYDTYLYHINAEYNEILNSSGTSSLNLTNPATNIKNGLGIFTAMSGDSLIFHVYTQ